MLHINSFFFNHQPIKLYLLDIPDREMNFEFKEKYFAFRATEVLLAFGIIDKSYLEYRPFFEDVHDNSVSLLTKIKLYFRKEKLIGIEELGSRVMIEWRGIANALGLLPESAENYNLLWEIQAFVDRYTQVLSEVYKERSSKYVRRNADGSEHIQYFCYGSYAELHRAVQIKMLSHNVVQEKTCFADIALCRQFREESIVEAYLSEEQLAISYGSKVGCSLSPSAIRDLLVQRGLLMKSLHQRSMRSKYEPTRIGGKYMLLNPRRWHKSVIRLLLTNESLA